MPGPELAAIKAAAEKRKMEKEAAAKAEKEARKGELSAERGAVASALAEKNESASQAGKEIEDYDAYLASGEADEEAKAQVDTKIGELKGKMEAALAKADKIKARLAQIDSELAAFGVEGAVAAEKAEAPQEAVSEAAPAETPKEAVAESAPEATEVASKEAEAEKTEDEIGADDIKRFFEKHTLDNKENIEYSIYALEKIGKGERAIFGDAAIQELKKALASIRENSERPGAVKDVEAIIRNVEHFREMRTNPEYLSKKSQESLEKMKSESGFERQHGRWELDEEIEDAEFVPGATARLVESIGIQPLDIVKENKIREQAMRDKLNEEPGKKKLEAVRDFYTEGFQNLPGIAAAIESVDPQKAEAYHEFIINGLVDTFKDKKPEEVRKALYASGTNASVYKELGLLLKRMNEGKEFSAATEESMAKLIPILEANDKTESVTFDEKKGPVSVKDESEFLTDKRIAAQLGYGHGRKKEEGERAVAKVRAAMQKIKDKYA